MTEATETTAADRVFLRKASGLIKTASNNPAR